MWNLIDILYRGYCLARLREMPQVPLSLKFEARAICRSQHLRFL